MLLPALGISLLVAWGVGLTGSQAMGGLSPLLLVAAAMLLARRVFTGRRFEMGRAGG